MTLSTKNLSSYRPSNIKRAEYTELYSMGPNISGTSATDNYGASIVNFVPGKGNEWNKRPGTLMIHDVLLEGFNEKVRPDHSVMWYSERGLQIYYLKDGYIYKIEKDKKGNDIGKKQDWYAYEEIFNFNYQEENVNKQQTEAGTYHRQNIEDPNYDNKILRSKHNNYNYLINSTYVIWSIGSKLLYIPREGGWDGIQKIDPNSEDSRVYLEPFVDSITGEPTLVNPSQTAGRSWLEVPAKSQDIYSYGRGQVNYYSDRPGYRTETFSPLVSTDEYLSPSTDGIGLTSSVLYKDWIDKDTLIEDTVIPFDKDDWSNDKFDVASAFVPFGSFGGTFSKSIDTESKYDAILTEFAKPNNKKSIRTLARQFGISDVVELDKIKEFAQTFDETKPLHKMTPHFHTTLVETEPNDRYAVISTYDDFTKLNKVLVKDISEDKKVVLTKEDIQRQGIESQDAFVKYMNDNDIDLVSNETGDLQISLLKYELGEFNEKDFAIDDTKKILGTSSVPYYGWVINHYSNNESITFGINDDNTLNTLNVTTIENNYDISPTWDYTKVNNEYQHGLFNSGNLIGTAIGQPSGELGIYSFDEKGVHINNASSVWKDNYYASSEFGKYPKNISRTIKNDNYIINISDDTSNGQRIFVYDNTEILERDVIGSNSKGTIRTYGVIDLEAFGIKKDTNLEHMVIDENDRLYFDKYVLDIKQIKDKLTFEDYNPLDPDNEDAFVSKIKTIQNWDNIITSDTMGVSIIDNTLPTYRNIYIENEYILYWDGYDKFTKVSKSDYNDRIDKRTSISPTRVIINDNYIYGYKFDDRYNYYEYIKLDELLNEIEKEKINYREDILVHYTNDIIENIQDKIFIFSNNELKSYISTHILNEKVNSNWYPLSVKGKLTEKLASMEIEIESNSKDANAINKNILNDNSIPGKNVKYDTTYLMNKNDKDKFIKKYTKSIASTYESKGDYYQRTINTEYLDKAEYDDYSNPSLVTKSGWGAINYIQFEEGIKDPIYTGGPFEPYSDELLKRIDYTKYKKNGTSLSLLDTLPLSSSGSILNFEDKEFRTQGIDLKQTINNMISKIISAISNNTNTQKNILISLNGVITSINDEITLDIIGMSNKNSDTIKGSNHALNKYLYEGLGNSMDNLFNVDTYKSSWYLDGGYQDVVNSKVTGYPMKYYNSGDRISIKGESVSSRRGAAPAASTYRGLKVV